MAKSISRYLADATSTTGALDGLLSIAAQTNITSLGTLSSLTVSGSAAMTLTTAAQPNITSVGTLSSLTVSGNIGGTLTTAAQPNITSVGTLTTLTVDDITINGYAISSSAANLHIDASGDIILDADGGDIFFDDGGTRLLSISNAGSNNVQISTSISDGDLLFKGNDGGSTITALTLDMSDAGTAIFNHDAHLLDNGKLVLGTGADTQILYDGSRLNINNTGDIFIDASGVVLIGGVTNTAGGYKFKVGGSDNQGELALFSNATAADLLSYDRTNSHYNTLNIHASPTNFTQGKVGIATAVGTSQLNIYTGNVTGAGTLASSAINIAHTTHTNGMSQMTFGYQPGSLTYAAAYIGYIGVSQAGNGNGDLVFGTRTATTDTQPTERMRIGGDGSVGIGITSPTSYYSKTLHINGAGDAAIKLTNSDTGATNGDGADIALDASEELRIMNRENNKINFWTNGNKALDIDGSGYITMPKQPFFQAHNGDGGSWQDVTVEQQWNTGVHNSDTDFWTDGTDRGGNFAASTGRFTAPVSGWYQFNASLYVRNTSSTTGVYVHPQFMRNGILGFNSGSGSAYNIIACRANSGTEYLDVRVTQNIYCSATQYVEFKIYWSNTSSGTWDHYPQYAFFSGGLIS